MGIPQIVSRAVIAGMLLATCVSSAEAEPVIRIAAKKFEFSPRVIDLKKGETVTLELTTLDRTHGFDAPDLGVKATIKPGAPTRVRVTPNKLGTFSFHCNVFCGDGHEDMTGQIVVHD